MLPNGIPELVEILVLESLRVHSPKPILLLCGGEIDVRTHAICSLREAYSRICINEPFSKYKTLIPEELSPFFPNGTYGDWLEYENDLAQISDVILLFSENYGSAAELGAFSMAPDISQKLMVTIDQKSYNESSFIKHGPIQHLTNKYGASSLLLMSNDKIGVAIINSPQGLKLPQFADYMKEGLAERAKRRDEHTTFNPKRNGHLIKLIAGLVQHYGALEVDEIDVFFDHLNIKCHHSTYQNLILCGKYAEWFSEHQIGARKFIVNSEGREALQYDVQKGSAFPGKVRWKTQVIEHWKSNDNDRFLAIQQGIRG